VLSEDLTDGRGYGVVVVVANPFRAHST